MSKHPLSVGSLLMVGLPGENIDPVTEAFIAEDGVHNFILFSRNVRSPAQLRALCDGLRTACLDHDLPEPLISIDQEGGSVTRLPPPFSQFPDQRQLAEGEDAEKLLADYARCCAGELREVGINLNLAPVLDICPAGENFFMERRCLGSDPQRVADLGALVISLMQQEGVATCVKHFPGLGRALLDPHRDLPVVDVSREELTAADLLPFRVAFAAGAASCMTSHALYERLDTKKPGTFSSTIMTRLLRDTLHYDGLLITDDLEMGAIEQHSSSSYAALEAFLAGADLLLICEDQGKMRQALASLRENRKTGRIDDAALEKALARQQKVREQFTFQH